jgi:hypothetical protein
MHAPNKYRVRKGAFASDESDGNNGAFFIPHKLGKAPLKVICSDGEGWEHVSVSLPARCPTWEEMCFVVRQFWDEGDCVMQLHPPRSEWVNNHPYCLHLWRPLGAAIPLPPSIMVGYRDLGNVLHGTEDAKAEARRRYWLENA